MSAIAEDETISRVMFPPSLSRNARQPALPLVETTPYQGLDSGKFDPGSKKTIRAGAGARPSRTRACARHLYDQFRDHARSSPESARKSRNDRKRACLLAESTDCVPANRALRV